MFVKLQERHLRSNTEIQLQSITRDLELAKNKMNENSGKAQRLDSVLEERNKYACLRSKSNLLPIQFLLL